ncbi:MAG: hypothetical protein V1701_02465 [Planctomycetota bacterium]
MIAIVMLLGDEKGALLWDQVISQKDEIAGILGEKGRLLYMTKRTGYNGVSLLVHIKEQEAVADLVSNRLSKIAGVNRLWVTPLYRPRFFPLPKDTHQFKRFVVTLKVTPSELGNVHKRLLNPDLPDGLKKVYYAFTFQLYDDVIQMSYLADKDATMNDFVTQKINTLKGVQKSSIYPIEKTKPFITYDEWQEYAGEKAHHPKWKSMFTHIKGWDM